ncbi:MAG: hypothetical protein R2862_12655 [Thermoanaerobaculia bacterium]
MDLLIATARVRFGTGTEEALAVLEAEVASNRHDLASTRPTPVSSVRAPASLP